LVDQKGDVGILCLPPEHLFLFSSDLPLLGLNLLKNEVFIGFLEFKFNRAVSDYLPSLFAKHPKCNQDVECIVDSPLDILLVLLLNARTHDLLVEFLLAVELIYKFVGNLLIGGGAKIQYDFIGPL
jgi:hypothetical protein